MQKCRAVVEITRLKKKKKELCYHLFNYFKCISLRFPCTLYLNLCAFDFIVRNDGAYWYISSLLILPESLCSRLSSVMMTEGHHTLSVGMPVLILQSRLWDRAMSQCLLRSLNTAHVSLYLLQCMVLNREHCDCELTQPWYGWLLIVFVILWVMGEILRYYLDMLNWRDV